MPLEVDVIPNPAYKPANAAEKAQFEKLKPHRVSYIQALENVRVHGERLIIKKEETVKAAPVTVPLEDRSLEDLKEMMVNLGVKTEKQMTRSQVVQVIRKKMDEFTIVEDDA